LGFISVHLPPFSDFGFDLLLNWKIRGKNNGLEKRGGFEFRPQ